MSRLPVPALPYVTVAASLTDLTLAGVRVVLLLILFLLYGVLSFVSPGPSDDDLGVVWILLGTSLVIITCSVFGAVGMLARWRVAPIVQGIGQAVTVLTFVGWLLSYMAHKTPVGADPRGVSQMEALLLMRGVVVAGTSWLMTMSLLQSWSYFRLIDRGDVATVTDLVRMEGVAVFRELDFTGNRQVGDEIARHIRRQAELVRLSLAWTVFSDAGVREMDWPLWLESLDLSGTRVTDAVFPSLVHMRSLKTLRLDATACTPEAAQTFAEERARLLLPAVDVLLGEHRVAAPLPLGPAGAEEYGTRDRMPAPHPGPLPQGGEGERRGGKGSAFGTPVPAVLVTPAVRQAPAPMAAPVAEPDPTEPIILAPPAPRVPLPRLPYAARIGTATEVVLGSARATLVLAAILIFLDDPVVRDWSTTEWRYVKALIVATLVIVPCSILGGLGMYKQWRGALWMQGVGQAMAILSLAGWIYWHAVLDLKLLDVSTGQMTAYFFVRLVIVVGSTGLMFFSLRDARSYFRLLDSPRLVDATDLERMDAGMNFLELDLSNNLRIGDEVGVYLARHARLARLDVAWTKLGDGTVRELAGLERLAYLDLSGTQVTDAVFELLAGSRSLEELRLLDTGCTAAGAAAFAAARARNGLGAVRVVLGRWGGRDLGWNA